MDTQDKKDEMKQKPADTPEEIKAADEAKDTSYEAGEKDAQQVLHVL